MIIEHKKLVNRIKKEHYQQKILTSDNPLRAVWSVVSELNGTEKCRPAGCIRLTVDGKNKENPEEVANIFNTFFIEAPKGILEDVKKQTSQISQIHTQRSLMFQSSMSVLPFSEDEILNIINNKIKNKRSSGPDSIPMDLFKRTAEAYIKQLTTLINLSFEMGTFPTDLKCAKVIPIFKKGDPALPENYRPIALTSCFSKVFEYAMLDRLLSYLSKNNILSTRQHGFVANRSTTSAVMSFLNEVILALEMGECPVGIFCDLSRAFDCVGHGALLDRMESYGVRGVVLDWFASYLSMREQHVEIRASSGESSGTARSENMFVDMGVPQGSVLGPVLFLLFVNPLPDEVMCSHVTMYADDTSALVRTVESNSLELSSNRALQELNNWFTLNELFLNAKKTNYMVFHTVQNRHNLDLRLLSNNVTLVRERSVKFLGLVLDDVLSWESHCLNLSAKLNSLCYAVRNLRLVLDLPQMISIYHAIIHSRIRYGVQFWGTTCHASGVFRSQKRILRCLAGVGSTSSCRPLFVQFGILPVPCVAIFEICLFVFGNTDMFLRNRNFHEYATRNNNEFVLSYSRLNISKNFIMNLGPKLFNRLPEVIKSSSSVSIFKKRLKLYLCDKCFYSIEAFINE